MRLENPLRRAPCLPPRDVLIAAPPAAEPIVRMAASDDEPAVDILRFFMEPIQLFAPGTRNGTASRRGGGNDGASADRQLATSSSSSQGLEPTDRTKRRNGGEDDDDGDGVLSLITCGARRGGSKRGAEGDSDDGCNVQ